MIKEYFEVYYDGEFGTELVKVILYRPHKGQVFSGR